MIRHDPTELRKYGGLALQARGIVEGFLSGVHRSPFKGYSVEFAEHRQYAPGDDIRHIDWRAHGKTDRYYIKEYEEETNLKAYIIVDASGSMAYRGRPDRPSKFEHARLAAASLAYLMLHQLDAVGLITHDDKVRSLLPARSGAKHLPRLLQALEAVSPGGETRLAAVWRDLAGHFLKRRGMVIILSDFFDEPDDITRALRHLRHRNHDVILFQVLAPEELEFPFDRVARFRDIENPGRLQTADPRRLREQYLRRFGEFRDQLRLSAGRLRTDYHVLRTDEPIEHALGRYLSRRRT